MSSEELRGIFAHHGMRITRQRESVFRVLCGCDEHPTAERLMHMVHAVDPEVSQATIYNTLDALVECGLANRIPATTSGGACRYDANMGEHVHLVLSDGRIMDVPHDLSQRIIDSVPESVLRELSDRTGVEFAGIKIELMGR